VLTVSPGWAGTLEAGRAQLPWLVFLHLERAGVHLTSSGRPGSAGSFTRGLPPADEQRALGPRGGRSAQPAPRQCPEPLGQMGRAVRPQRGCGAAGPRCLGAPAWARDAVPPGRAEGWPGHCPAGPASPGTGCCLLGRKGGARDARALSTSQAANQSEPLIRRFDTFCRNHMLQLQAQQSTSFWKTGRFCTSPAKHQCANQRK